MDDVADPVVTPHHVLIRPLYSLISSGTETADIHQEGVLKEVAENPSHLRKIWDVMKGAGPTRTLAEVHAKFKEYAVLGYSGAGVLVDAHPTVTDLEVGDRVAYGGQGTGHGETVLAGRNLVARVPDNVPFQHACFTTLGSIAMNAVRIAGIGVGDTVAVIGLGLVGQLVSQLVRVQGGVVFGIDVRDDRVKLAQALGADYSIVGSQSTPEEVLALTSGRGVDCVIVAAASKSPVPAVQAIQMCRDRGRVVVVGAIPLDLPRDLMYIKELQLLMARAYGPGSYDPLYEEQGCDYPLSYVRWTENRNMEECLRLVGTGRVELQSLITHEFPLADAASAYQTIMDPAANSLAVLLRYPSSEMPHPERTFAPVRRIETKLAVDENRADLRVALVGAGNLARWAHLPNIKKIPGIRLHAVYSSSGSRGKSYALRFGAAYSCSDFDEVLNDPKVDVVLIASRHQHHASQALASLRAGKHVFLEKPMALTEAECQQLYRAVEETGKQLTVGFNRRFAPFYVEQKKSIRGRSGPAIISIRMNSPGLSGSSWAADPAIGGAILGEACHFIDLMYWLLDSEPIIVSAFMLPLGKDEPIGENNIVASLRFADGSIGNLTYCTVGTKTSGGERVEVFAPGISIITEDMKRLIVNASLRRTKKNWWAEKGYAAQLESFTNGIRNGNAPQVTVRDGARATVGGLRILESARTMKPCEFALDEVLR